MDRRSKEMVRPNRLIHETSPYLLEHAHNPVDWYPWSREAFERAGLEDKPLFLSIGYSACHWCHVMEQESFEDEAIARIMNERFVCIKVDREERPDVDALYMEAVQRMTGSGGWPLSVFATPEGKPFYGGTYFPPEDVSGRPGFPRLLQAIAQAWDCRREELRVSAEAIQGELVRQERTCPSGLSEDLLHNAANLLGRLFDPDHGGFGTAPKFPQTGTLVLLMHYAQRYDNPKALDRVTRTLEAMAAGGLFDHLGGGFHRYATDTQWRIPHFEKMLYDQALLTTAYTRAYQVTRQESFARTARQTLDCMLRDLGDPAGTFSSSLDADSEGREGALYVWTPEQIRAVVGEPDASLVCDHYGVDEGGLFEKGASVLYIRRSIKDVAGRFGMEAGQVAEVLERSRTRLYEARCRRVQPHRDGKIITAWNGLALSSLAIGGAALAEARYVRVAERAAGYLLGSLVDQGRLMHSLAGSRLSGPGFLDDYAFLAAGLLDLYDATLEPRWLLEAKRLAEQMVTLFQDPEGGAFFFTGQDAERLIVRTKGDHDGALPGGNAMAAMTLLRLGHLTLDRRFTTQAAALLESYTSIMATSPMAASVMLTALDLYLGPTQEIALVGERGDPEIQGLIDVVHRRFLPRTVLVHRPTGPDPGPIADVIPSLCGLTPLDGRPTAYVCRDYACDRPVHTAAELERWVCARV